MGGHGLGRVCVHINHFGYHIKEIHVRLLKVWGAAMPKGPGEKYPLSEVPLYTVYEGKGKLSYTS